MSEPGLRHLDEQRPALAATLRRWWRTPLAEYSAALWAAPPPAAAIESALAGALAAEQRRVWGIDAPLPAVLSTAHHVTPTNGPGFLAADRIAGAGRQGRLVVAAWSGVPMRNAARSGAISFAGPLASVVRPGTPTWRRHQSAMADRRRDEGPTEHRLALLPARQQDALLYQAPLPERLPSLLADLQPAAAALLGPPVDDLPTWSLRACAAIQRAVLGRQVHYLDLCRVMRDYLLAVLPDPGHPLSAAIADPRPLVARFPHAVWFTARRQGRRGEKVDLLRPQGGAFVGRGQRVPAAEVPQALAEGRICPGLLLSFSALNILNPIRCLGSFNQVAYLAEFARGWAELGVCRPADPAPTLIAGRAVDADGIERYPLDLALSGAPAPPPDDAPMSALWRPLLPRLLRR